MSDRPTGQAPSRLVAVLGPTNTGKTHLAVERMLGHASGMIGLPLRLLAREIYDRIVKLRGKNSVALVTGEEKIIPSRAVYWVCTVEAMPLNRDVEFLCVDEIQLCADRERGHIFTHRLLHARGKYETMFLGSGAMTPLVRRLLGPDVEIISRERLSVLSYAGSKKLTRLPRRSAVVAFSADAVYAIAELIRRQRGGAAVVMGSLSPRTRNAQVALYQSGEVDFLVATDAIGMGLNMDVDHVAFAGLRKFDGRRSRWLTATEVAQIGGRAGRFRRDGTFGVTGEAPEIDEDLVDCVENHRFAPIEAAEWRNSRLDFGSLPNLLRSLSSPPPAEGLKLSEEAIDETTLRRLAAEDEVVRTVRDRSKLIRLWDACQIPEFRKTTLDEHVRLVRSVFEGLTGPGGRLPEDWIAPQFKALDRTDGEIDALSGRLAHVRTLAYVANRPDWLSQAEHWRERTRGLEDRLSDTLHEKLMARFIDRRTSVLMRALHVREEVLAGVADDGAVTIEGQYVGRLRGLQFDAAQGATQLEDRALRAAAQRAVGPEVARRLGQLAGDEDTAFSVQPDGVVTWRGSAAGKIEGGSPFAPRVSLYGELGPEPARERAARRLEAYLAGEAGRRLGSLRRLRQAMEEGQLKGLARGIGWRLLEAGGVIDRRTVDADLKALSQAERRMLRGLGVRIGAFSLWIPALLKPQARLFASAFSPDHAFSAPASALSPAPDPAPGPRTLSAHGLRQVGRHLVAVEALERLDELMRAAPRQGGAAVLSDQAREELGWSEGEAAAVLKGLGFASARKPKEGEQTAWRQRRERVEPQIKPRPDSPFAALAALTAPPARRKRPRRRKPAAKVAS
jgi:ATP-dependent RNA helicase SUPV3L1/SUV3